MNLFFNVVHLDPILDHAHFEHNQTKTNQVVGEWRMETPYESGVILLQGHHYLHFPCILEAEHVLVVVQPVRVLGVGESVGGVPLAFKFNSCEIVREITTGYKSVENLNKILYFKCENAI